MKYVDYELELAPPWLAGPIGEKWHQVQGLVKDSIVEGALQAIKARLLKQGPDDALSYAGTDRQIERAPSEPVASYRARLLKAFETWRLAGTNKGILEALKVIGFSSVAIIENKDWKASPDPDAWWLFWIEFFPPMPLSGTSWKLGDGTKLGEKPLGFGSVSDLVLLDLVRRVVRKWKAAHTICASLVFVFSGKLIGSGWHLGDGTTLGGDAAYLDLFP